MLGHLVGTGCKADGARLKSLTTELNTDTNCLNLKNFLQSGGFGTLDGSGVATGTEKDCLAHLFAPGCDGDPALLTTRLAALNDTSVPPNALADVKGVMIAGELGKYPAVPGDLYKHGCLADPDGAADGSGAKTPEVLIDMLAGFSGATDAAKFKKLLDNGGLNHRDATGKGPRNIMFASSTRTGNPSDLKTCFFDKLTARHGQPQASVTPKLTLDALIYTAASFECESVPARQQRVALTPSGKAATTLRADGVTARRTPPEDVEGITGSYGYFAPVNGSYKEADGNVQAVTSKIGFNPDPSSTDAPPKTVVGQFFPIGGPNLQKVHNKDMHAIKDALNI